MRLTQPNYLLSMVIACSSVGMAPLISDIRPAFASDAAPSISHLTSISRHLVSYEDSLPLSLPAQPSRVLLGNTDLMLEGTLWQLTAYRTATGELVEPAIYRVQGPTMQLEDGRVSGNATCNRYFGSYSLSNNDLTVIPGGSTLMACPEEYMAQEQAYTNALAQVTSYALKDGELMLMNAAGETLLTFTEFNSPAITSTRWRLLVYNNGTGGLVTPIAETVIISKFEDSGELAGFAGCNNFMASYESTDNSLSIGPAASTRKACSEPAGVMAQETAFLQLLEMVESYTIEGNILEMQAQDGTVIARFAAVTDSESGN